MSSAANSNNLANAIKRGMDKGDLNLPKGIGGRVKMPAKVSIPPPVSLARLTYFERLLLPARRMPRLRPLPSLLRRNLPQRKRPALQPKRQLRPKRLRHPPRKLLVNPPLNRLLPNLPRQWRRSLRRRRPQLPKKPLLVGVIQSRNHELDLLILPQSKLWQGL